MIKIGDYEIILKDACLETTCYWHTSHWTNVYRNGCYKFADISACEKSSGYTPLKEGLKKERPDLYKKLFPDG